MKKLKYLSLLSVVILGACDKHDPVLPGARTSIFESEKLEFTNDKMPELSKTEYVSTPDNCPYTQDSKNNIWRGETKIFSGFATSDFVKSNQKPVCKGNYIYAGLTTGELLKINKNTRTVDWVANIYSNSNITGGGVILDITAPMIIRGDFIYVAGLGNAICKVSINSGNKAWCAPISIADKFILVGDVIFSVDVANKMYAINTSNGKVYWEMDIDNTDSDLSYADGILTFDGDEYDAKTGKLID